jgi:hypothetical protein
VNAASLPADAQLTAEMDALVEAFTRPATPSIIEQAYRTASSRTVGSKLGLRAYINDVRAGPGTLSSR